MKTQKRKFEIGDIIEGNSGSKFLRYIFRYELREYSGKIKVMYYYKNEPYNGFQTMGYCSQDHLERWGNRISSDKITL